MGCSGAPHIQSCPGSMAGKRMCEVCNDQRRPSDTRRRVPARPATHPGASDRESPAPVGGGSVTRFRVVVVAALLAGLFAGCSGDDRSAVPDVVGRSLDVARRFIENAGYEVEVIGGGLFGVVVESNWTVCSQRPTAGTSSDDPVVVTVDRVCPGAASGETGSGATETGSVPDGGTFVMPELVGMNLQDAQDRLQSLGSYVLDQEDASGLGRIQILDSNWVVCRQSPAPGTDVGLDEVVTLWSVKIDETCP